MRYYITLMNGIEGFLINHRGSGFLCSMTTKEEMRYYLYKNIKVNLKPLCIILPPPHQISNKCPPSPSLVFASRLLQSPEHQSLTPYKITSTQSTDQLDIKLLTGSEELIFPPVSPGTGGKMHNVSACF